MPDTHAIGRRAALKQGAGILLGISFMHARSAFALTNCLDSPTSPTNHWAIFTASQKPTAATPVGKLGEAIMLRSRNPYFKDSGTSPWGADSVVRAPAWQSRIQKDFTGAQWSFQGRSLTVDKAIRIPYIVRDADDACVEETLLIGFQRLPLRASSLPAWGDTSAEPAATKNVAILGETIVSLCKPKDGGTAVQAVNWDATSRIDTDGVNKWEFRDRPTRVEKVVRFHYGIDDGAPGQSRAFLYVGYEGGGAY